MNAEKPGRSVLCRTVNRTLDAITVYTALAKNRPDTVLLESRDANGISNTQSLLLVRSALRLESRGRSVEVTPLTPVGRQALEVMLPACSDLGTVTSLENSINIEFPERNLDASEAERIKATGPMDMLRLFAFGWNDDGTPPLSLPGMFAYDFLDTFETLPQAREDVLGIPDMLFELPELLVRIDPDQGVIQIEQHAFGVAIPDEHDIDSIVEVIEHLAPPTASKESRCVPSDMPSLLKVDMVDAAYCKVVETLKHHIVAGDVFQIVPSRTFHLPCNDALSSYRKLRGLNPSPYLFYFAAKSFTLFGSSPETCVRVDGNPRTVTLYPIAGTRPRGRTPDGKLDRDLDNRMEAELKLHEKELAEHMMLVDLARNDVARISEPGTRHVSRLLEIERYSHVMHLVSKVEGVLRDGLDALHAYLATMTMGTLTGAPKVEAARLLRQHELDRRGPYGGAVGYVTSDGTMDTAIVIRSAVVKDGLAYVRAGAGIVFDSDPQAEADETRNKANAVLQAIAASVGGAA